MTFKNKTYDRKFQDLATQINQAIIENEGLIGDQKAQVELMISLERKFQFYIQQHGKIIEIYQKFIELILNSNILSARPYFREKSTTFSDKITKIIRDENPKGLMNYQINYLLIQFIAENWNGKFPEKAQRYYDEFLEARRILIENNLPLAINRAKLFYRKTPRSHLSLLDLINICTCGLINGIDKYVGEYTKVWRSVCIGRMVGNMIEEYSKTFLRLYPTDKKILYRANSLKYRLKIESITELTAAVNESFERDRVEHKKIPQLPISEMHVRTLLNGSHYIPTDSKINEDNNGGGSINIYDYTPNLDDDLEEQVDNHALLKQITQFAKELKTIERKIIKLKGVEL